MKENNVIVEKSYSFSLRIIKLHMHLKEKGIDRILTSQILKSGTSIGANVEEAIAGSSRRDFINKLRIALRESRETNYWLKLLKDSQLLEDRIADSMMIDCEELVKILTAIINSTIAKTVS